MIQSFTELDESLLRHQVVQNGNFENLLSYYLEPNEKLIGNLNTGITIDIEDESIFEQFHVATDMFWPQVSLLIYGTDTLYWFLMLLNQDIIKSPFDKIKAPTHIRYLPNALEIINRQS